MNILFLSTEKLKEKLLSEICCLEDVNLSEYYFQETDGKGNEGTYIYSNNRGSYYFVYSERGNISKLKITDSVFEISFWFVNSIASEIAIKYMNDHYKTGENYRTGFFNKQLETLEKVGENYKKAGEIEISEILKNNP